MLKKKKTTSNFIQELRVLAFREAFWKPASGQRAVMAIAMTAFSLAAIQCAKAQIVPDNSLGAESSTVILDNINGLDSDRIEGGATRGANLFHSFESFNVDSGRGAYFVPSAAIENVLTRVTGGNSSNILGTLGVLGNANLFLINPNGFVFGSNARLDLNGSFTGSTADSLVFENGFQFSASNPDAPPLLTINVPIGLRFRDNPGDIVVETGQNPAPRIVSEEGDAGRLLDTAQTVNNESTVPNSIQGELVENNDVDLYRISLSEGTTITPTTVGGSGVDTRLFLFDSEGLGIAANEDSAGTLQSTLPSFTASSEGIYYLGVSSLANAPVSEGGEIFAFNFETFQFEGAGPGAAAPLRGWNDFGFASGAYNITLTEVESNEASLSVAPGQTLALIGGNLILDGGKIESPGSNVALGGLTAAGTVTLNPDLSVNFPENVARGDVTITGGIVDVRGDDGGNIVIAARDLVITGQSQLLGGIAAGLGSPDARAGDIEIRATGVIDLDNSLIRHLHCLASPNSRVAWGCLRCALFADPFGIAHRCCAIAFNEIIRVTNIC